MDLVSTLLGPGRAFLTKISNFSANLIGAILILIGSWILAKFMKMLVFKFLTAVRFDMASEKAGINEILIKGEIRQSSSELVSTLIYWLIMMIGLVLAVSNLGLDAVNELLNQILLYIFKIIGAIFVLILGLFFANILAGIVRTVASNVGIHQADALGTMARYALIIFTAAVALQELGIGAELVRSAFNIIFGAVAFAFALAFGLGCKDLVRDWVVKYLEELSKSKKKKIQTSINKE